ncbi:hypothetical protein C8F01DRAFT_648513 [Mycena amicta]|nr:hypothetical protein C8F01DRAFT_648513 [Mycena amicta]
MTLESLWGLSSALQEERPPWQRSEAGHHAGLRSFANGTHPEFVASSRVKLGPARLLLVAFIFSDGIAFHNFPPVTSSTSDCRARNLLHPASDTSNCESGTAGSSMAVLGCCLVLGLWTLPSPILGSACSFLRLTDDGGISSSRLSLALQDAPATLAT